MEPPSTYADLSLVVDKIIDVPFFLKKIQNNGFSVVALDFQLTDTKPNTIKTQRITLESMTVLKRITLIIQNSSSLHALGQKQAPYDCDILAVKPMNEKMFHTLCTQYDSYDIITFDIQNKLPFMLKRNPVYQAIRKALFNQSQKVVAMTNMINIIKATGGKNLIVSSHANQNGTHRTPYDVAALLISLGLDKSKALLSIKQNCHEVIRSGQHRLYLKGAIHQIPVKLGKKLNKRIQKHRQNIRNTNKVKHQKLAKQ